MPWWFFSAILLHVKNVQLRIAKMHTSIGILNQSFPSAVCTVTRQFMKRCSHWLPANFFRFFIDYFQTIFACRTIIWQRIDWFGLTDICAHHVEIWFLKPAILNRPPPNCVWKGKVVCAYKISDLRVLTVSLILFCSYYNFGPFHLNSLF